MRSASCTAFRIERVVSSMSATTPRRIPVVRACPTPSTFTDGCFGRSPTTSPMMAVVFDEPISSPATMRSGFIGLYRRNSERRCEARKRGTTSSRESGNDLVSVSQIELDRAQPASSQILLDQFDLGKTTQSNATERSNGKRVEHEDQIRLA